MKENVSFNHPNEGPLCGPLTQKRRCCYCVVARPPEGKQPMSASFLPSAIRPFLCRSFVFPLALPLSRGTRERTMLLKRARILPLKKGDEARDEKKTEGGRKQVPPQTFHI